MDVAHTCLPRFQRRPVAVHSASLANISAASIKRSRTGPRTSSRTFAVKTSASDDELVRPQHGRATGAVVVDPRSAPLHSRRCRLVSPGAARLAWLSAEAPVRLTRTAAERRTGSRIERPRRCPTRATSTARSSGANILIAMPTAAEHSTGGPTIRSIGCRPMPIRRRARASRTSTATSAATVVVMCSTPHSAE